jgi:hypothetical protein
LIIEEYDPALRRLFFRKPVVAERSMRPQALTRKNALFAGHDSGALTWLGRGDGGLEDWRELRAEAARAHNRRTATYLLGIPLLADYLGEAASPALCSALRFVGLWHAFRMMRPRVFGCADARFRHQRHGQSSRREGFVG